MEQLVRQVWTGAADPEWLEYVRSKAKPAARCVLEPEPAEAIGSGASRFGGHPDVPERFAWPRSRTGRFLTFVCQIDLAECAAVLGPGSDIPPAGCLLLFFDVRHSEGLEDGPQDHDKFKLHYVPAGTPLRRLVRPKPLVNPDPSPVPTLPPHRCRFVGELTLPAHPDRDAPGPVGEAWLQLVRAFESAAGDGPLHRVGGHPAPPQDDPLWLCCLNRAGLSHELLSPRHPAIGEAEREVPSWRLLLQVECDDRIEFRPSSDRSCLFVCATAESIRGARFDRYWVSTQGS